MPVDEEKALMDIVGEMGTNQVFKKQVYAAVRKIIRLKICLGLL
jgi:beta-N-acetylhexosaminidase